MLCWVKMSKIILAESNGIKLKRKFIERPLGYFIKLKKGIDTGSMALVWIRSAGCVI